MKKDLKRGIMRAAGVLLAMVLMITAAGYSAAPVYAGGDGEDEPNIIWQADDLWLLPDAIAFPAIYFDKPVNNVNLYFWSQSLNDWDWHQTCTKGDTNGMMWYGEVDPQYWAEDYITLRFAASFDGGVLYSEEFTIEWTDYYGSERIAGSNRYETAQKIAYTRRLITGGALSKYPNVIIACGTNFADALGGAYLAECFDAPILLVNNNQDVIDEVVMEIMSNLADGGKIFILGGEGAVSGEMEKRLAAGGFSASQIVRFAGKNRYDTNLQILKYCEVYRLDILVCSGKDFPDALSASAVGLPILLVGDSISEEDFETIGSMKGTSFTIIGGPGAVSEKVEKQLKDRMGAENVGRIAGDNRYQTSVKVASQFFADKQRFYITLAYGRNFPDGLAGGPLCLALRPGAPLILADNTHYLDAENAAAEVGARFAFVLGGETLISDEVADRILHHPDLS
ncbi:MAG: cell wall-binding repeat-containing protein [Clostridia bacterium]|nr:cell wall-binding repeat-containing protein [Clostridia bacterium]